MSEFLSGLKNELLDSPDNLSRTENGALGYKTTGKALMGLNFALSSLRNESEDDIWHRFLAAYNETPDLSVAWLFFSRDIRQGSGERRTFRVIFPRLADLNPALAEKLLAFIPEYGRWDDLVFVMDKIRAKTVQKAALSIISEQLRADLDSLNHGGSVSLLAKWLPSAVTSSKETRRLANIIRDALGMTPRQYRKTLSCLRRRIDIVEARMSANEWNQINYQGVPSRAMLNYRSAFGRHDQDGFSAYLEKVKSGESKIHSGTLYPHDIYHAYAYSGRDDTLEAQWKALPNTVPPGQDTLVVVDGSGSMLSRVGNTALRAIEVSRGLGLYFAERLHGPFKDHFITFSSRPQLVYLNPDLSLYTKINMIQQYDDCSNTDIEKTFDLILNTAVKNNLSQSELPANVLIISDMEFDEATTAHMCTYEKDSTHSKLKTLFDTIADKFERAGYKLPRLIFWNVCSRTGTIPVRQNDLGVALVSGFSPNIADMVMSGKLDPWECLVDKLTSDRYQPILNEVRSLHEHD